ncbi:Unknown protein [Striga hermonthica]|uniref:Uncharacterized protein n=1 Tax=Striga hermonthica TaxID=68872 RepID=A0A9N7NK15_STRHE|nr:Unknown protein [Striga hermonthica]
MKFSVGSGQEKSPLSLFWLPDLNMERPPERRESSLTEERAVAWIFMVVKPETAPRRRPRPSMMLVKVSGLPFCYDADISIKEALGSLRFITATDDLGNEVCAAPMKALPLYRLRENSCG